MIPQGSIMDVILRNGLLYDGSGKPPVRGDLAIQGDTIAGIGDLGDATAPLELDVDGLAVAPGFINMLSWAVESLIEDGRSLSDIRQGVTLEVMGEGFSYGPLSEAMKANWRRGALGAGEIEYELAWTTLGEYLTYLEKRGVSCNVASFVGLGTLRIHAMGYDDRPPTSDELENMLDLLRLSMEEGAVGLAAALIYPPQSFAQTDELIALAKMTAAYDGLYISHLRSEGAAFLEALDELITIAREANIRAEVYHLKAAGYRHWPKMDEAIQRIEAARASGLDITADMYTYPFSGTGLESCIPPWVHEGDKLVERLKDPALRERIKQDMNTPSTEWENMWLETGSPERMLLAGFPNPEHKQAYAGKRLSEVAAMRGQTPEDALLDLVVENDGHIFTMYFTMLEDNLRKQVTLPWLSFCSDAESLAPEGIFLQTHPHPRAYGSFARVIGHYCRDEGLMPLEDAVRRLSALPAATLRLDRRGALLPGYFADVVVFDPAEVRDHATYDQPHQLATGMVHVFVNGQQVLKDGEHTGATPGRFVRGPGARIRG
ncbi:MAG: D-aminoacylase [Anaerolineae bacterium]